MAAIVLFGVAALLGAAFVIFVRGDDGPSHPDKWDARVLPIVKIVERERGLDFDEPVHVDFLTAAEYRKATAGDESITDPSAKDKADAANVVALLRAVGLVAGEFDLFKALGQVSDSGTLAFYSPESERITVRGTTLTPSLRVTLAHELTHALQDQQFDLKRIETLSGVRSETLRAIVEGDAGRIEDQYVAKQLSADERKAYVEEQAASAKEATETLGNVPDIILSSFQSPYVFGPRLVALLQKEQGEGAIDGVIKDPPASTEQLISPFAYLEGDKPVTVKAPELPKGAKRDDQEVLGSLDLFLMLAERIDPVVALQAADGWGGDSYISYRRKGTSEGTVCVAGRFVGDTTADTLELDVALRLWAAAMPPGSASSKGGANPSFTSCDLGAKSNLKVTGQASKALAYLAARFEIAATAVAQGSNREQASCYALGVVSHLTLEQVSDEDATFVRSAEFQRIVLEAAAACR